MKIQILPLVLLLCLPIGSQQVVENSDMPTNKNASRIVKLEEVLRIKENGKDIIFSYPYDLQIGPDNGIYFYDSWQLYKFDSEGNFRLLDKMGPARESTPIVHDGRIYIASRNGYLYCLGEAGTAVDY